MKPQVGGASTDGAVCQSWRPMERYGARSRKGLMLMVNEFFLSTIPAPSQSNYHAHSQVVFGKANYSYRLAMQKFMHAFRDGALPVRELSFPAIVPDATSLLRSPTHTAVHLAFYPPEEIRILKNAVNILLFVWEFSVLRTDDMLMDSHAFASHLKMLSKVSHIWTASHYSARVLRRSTQTPVAVIPAPISACLSHFRRRLDDRSNHKSTQSARLMRLEFVPLAIFPRFQAETSQAVSNHRITSENWTSWLRHRDYNAKVFLTILNPHDIRKGLKAGIEAFCRFADQFPNASWIIKTSSHDDDQTTINTRLMSHQIIREDELAGQYFCPRIWITNQILDDDEMNALYGLADFYICTSHAEGQNFPLQEAMACGVVPISVAHTAMEDYINEANALVIKSHEVPLPASAARQYGLVGATWFEVKPVDIYRNLRGAMALSAQRYADLSHEACKTIVGRFSGSVIIDRVMRLVA